MTLDEKEFNLFCEAIVKAAIEEDVSFKSITTILAKAIKRREDALEEQARQQKQESSVNNKNIHQDNNTKDPKETVMETRKSMQPVYGPPPRQNVVEEVREMLQPVYGPPPREISVQEVMIQPVYGPPPRKI